MAIVITSELVELFQFPAVSCAPGGGRFERISVPMYQATAEFPESDLDALLVTGDLQFYDRSDGPEWDRVLMGFVVANELAELADVGMIPARDRIGVVLTGDLYAVPSLMERGGSGDVLPIWEEFANSFRWVAGVAGNHDLFDKHAVFPACLRHRSNVFPLHGADDRVEVDRMKIGGISGIQGNPRKIWRYTNDFFFEHARRLLGKALDLFVLHQGPVGSQCGMRGSNAINLVLDESATPPSLTACGHCHWPQPLDQQERGGILNTDGCVVLLTREGATMQLGGN